MIAESPTQLNDQELLDIRTLIFELTGICMAGSKREFIYRRLGARLKATNIGTFREYLSYLEKGDPYEVEAFTNSITTNLTSFFREPHHFEYLANTIVPQILSGKETAGKRLRIWSAGCSTGEEPYSIAIVLRESFTNLAQWDAKILCTDLDTDVLRIGETGRYTQQRVENLSEQRLRRWFGRAAAECNDCVSVNAKLQALCVFKQLNLMHEWPMKGRFDCIFCRNVIIYFDKPTQRILIDRFADILADEGTLILGHSESLVNVSERFSLIGHTIYQKIR